MKVFRKVLLVLAVLVGIVGAFVAWRIGPRNIIGMIRYDQRKEGTLKPGDAAPDVALALIVGAHTAEQALANATAMTATVPPVSLDGKTPVRVSEQVGGKPLVLVFGSYT